MKPQVFSASVFAVRVVMVMVGALAVALMGVVDSASIQGNGPDRQNGRQSRSAVAGEEGEWSTWINSDSPLTGDGDFETVDTITEAYTICRDSADSIVRAQCRVLGTNLTLDTTSGVFGEDHLLQPCSVQGLVCLNRQQPQGRCQDYEVRFLCRGEKDKGQGDGALFPDFDFKIYVILAIVPLAIVAVRILWSCCCRYRCQHRRRTASRSAAGPRTSRLSTSSSGTSFDASLALPPPSYTDLFGSTAIFSPGPVAPPGPGKAFAVFSITDGRLGTADSRRCCCCCNRCPGCSSACHPGCQHSGPLLLAPRWNPGDASDSSTPLTSAHDVFPCRGWSEPSCPCLLEARRPAGVAECRCAGERSDVGQSAAGESSSGRRREVRRKAAQFLRSLSFPTFHALAEVTSEEESDDVFEVPAVPASAVAAPAAAGSGSPGHTPRQPRRFSTTAVMPGGGPLQTLVRNGSDTALLLRGVPEPRAQRGPKSVNFVLAPRQEQRLQMRLCHRRTRSDTTPADSSSPRPDSGCAPCASSSGGGGGVAARRASAHACACPCHHLHLAHTNPAFQWENETQSFDGHVARGSRIHLPGMHRPVLGLSTSGSLTSFASSVTEPPDYEEALEILSKRSNKIGV